MAKIKGETKKIIDDSIQLRNELKKFGWTLWGQKINNQFRWRLRNIYSDEKIVPANLDGVRIFLNKLNGVMNES